MRTLKKLPQFKIQDQFWNTGSSYARASQKIMESRFLQQGRDKDGKLSV